MAYMYRSNSLFRLLLGREWSMPDLYASGWDLFFPDYSRLDKICIMGTIAGCRTFNAVV